jgi:hypothetical protein
MTLRPALFQSISRALSREDFLSTDFRIETETLRGELGTKVKIQPLITSGYFNATIPAKRRIRKTEYKGEEYYYEIVLAYSPGKLNITESSEAPSEAGLLEEIEHWVIRLSEDIRNSPIARSLSDAEKRIDDLYTKIGIENADSPLNEEEQASILDWIKSIEKKMGDNLQQQNLKEKILEEKLRDLHIQIETITNLIKNQLPKKGIVRALLGRVMHWSSQPENQQLLKDAGSTVAGLLGPGSATDASK